MNFVHVPPAVSHDSLVMYLAMHWKAGLSCPMGGGQEIPSKLFGITHMSIKERLKKKVTTETTCNISIISRPLLSSLLPLHKNEASCENVCHLPVHFSAN